MPEPASRPKPEPNAENTDPPVAGSRGLAESAVTVGALGVVFGDIGTSPL